jgi:hypothetical protein
MEWLYYFLRDFLQVWKWQGLQNGVIAIAIAAQFWVAYRLWRPKVEIFLDLVDFKLYEHSTLGKLDVQISNLSNIGIWVEAIELVVQDVKRLLVGKLTSEPARTVVPPYTAVTRFLHEAALRAYPEELGTTAFDKAVVSVRARYRVHGRWHRTKWQTYSLELSMAGIRNLKAL